MSSTLFLYLVVIGAVVVYFVRDDIQSKEMQKTRKGVRDGFSLALNPFSRDSNSIVSRSDHAIFGGNVDDMLDEARYRYAVEVVARGNKAEMDNIPPATMRKVFTKCSCLASHLSSYQEQSMSTPTASQDDDDIEAENKTSGATVGDAADIAARQSAARLAALASLPEYHASKSAGIKGQGSTSRCTRSPMSVEELEEYKAALIKVRRRIEGELSASKGQDTSVERSGGSSSLGAGDISQKSDEFEQALSLRSVARQRRLLWEIEAALDRIDNGVYGICEFTGNEIQRDRLHAKPWCRYSLEGERMAND